MLEILWRIQDFKESDMGINRRQLIEEIQGKNDNIL